MQDSDDRRIGRLEARYEAHVEDYVDLKRLVTEMQHHLRELENWRLEVSVYLRQIRWLVALAIAALVTGLINIVLNLELHG